MAVFKIPSGWVSLGRQNPPRFSAEPNFQNSISHPRVTRIFHSRAAVNWTVRQFPSYGEAELLRIRAALLLSQRTVGGRLGGHLPRPVAAGAPWYKVLCERLCSTIYAAASMPLISLRATLDERKIRRFRSSPRRKLISPPSRMAKPER
jgi:hypothetical protein